MNETVLHVFKSALGPFILTLLKLWPIWLILGGCAILALIIKSRTFKGKAGEFAVGKLSELMLGEEYRVIHDIILTRSDKENATTQLDHIVVARSGLFVIETKNFSGTIYGKEKAKTWTQYLGGKKSIFQNPLQQNYLHTRTLADALEVPHSLWRESTPSSSPTPARPASSILKISGRCTPPRQNKRNVSLFHSPARPHGGSLKGMSCPKKWVQAAGLPAFLLRLAISLSFLCHLL